MSNTYLTRTPSSSGNRKTFTFSFWFKRSKLSSNQNIYNQYNSSNGYNSAILFNSSDDFIIWDYTNAYQLNLITDRKFRDVNAWYHAVIAVDTTQATASNRAKIYINGVQETSFSTATYPSQNLDLRINEYQPQQIGVFRYASTNGNFFDGSMSHFHFIDGTAYDASAFGETDATTGEWKIKTSPSVTYGTNGYWILKDGNTITDSSPNSNNFTVGGGTLTKTEDNPSSVMCTLNPLWTLESTRVPTLTLGNNMFSGGSSSTWYQTIGTLGFSSGKYYWEAKYNAGTNLGKNLVGAIGIDGVSSGVFYEKTPSIFYKNEDGGEYRLNNSQSSGNYGTLAQNDILGCAIDMDASTPTATFYKNGTALVSNISLTGFAGKTIVPAVSTYSSGEFQMNFGNGSFGGTALTGTTYSGADGSSTFQYEPPTGYSAVSTKGLNA